MIDPTKACTRSQKPAAFGPCDARRYIKSRYFRKRKTLQEVFMISKEELETIIKSILARGSRKYTTQSGAFLEILRDLSFQKRIEDIADANAIYVKIYPTVGEFIAAMLPGILVNHYFADLKDFPFDAFIRWSLTDPDWAKPLKDNFNKKEELSAAIKKIMDSVTEFKKDSL